MCPGGLASSGGGGPCLVPGPELRRCRPVPGFCCCGVSGLALSDTNRGASSTAPPAKASSEGPLDLEGERGAGEGEGDEEMEEVL